MPAFVNVSGIWKEVTAPSFNNNGTFVDLTKIIVNISGTWMSIWEALIWDKDTYIVLDGVTATQMNDAINRMTNGGMLLFGAGTWDLTDCISIKKDNITIKGVPNLTTIRSFSNNGAISILGTSESVKISNTVIDGITFKNMADLNSVPSNIYTIGIDNVYNDRVTIKNCTIQGYRIGVATYGTTSSSVINNIIQNNKDESIYVESTSDLSIVNNFMQNNDNYAFLSVSMTNSKIIGNVIQNNKQAGMSLVSSNNNIINNNTVQNNFAGIGMEASNYNTVSSNVVNNCLWENFWIKGCSYNTFMGNVNQYGNYTGFYLYGVSSNNIIIGNTMQNNGRYGLHIDTQVSNCIITGNISTSNSSANYINNSVGSISNYNITS